MLNVVLVGYGELASSLLLGILESKHNLKGVLRWEKIEHNPFYLNLKDFISPDPFYSLIKQNKIPEINAKSVNSEEFKKEILKIGADVILIGSWGEILKKDAIILPKVACVNCHPSMLPHYRGSNPYYAAIRAGEKLTGVSFHLVDTGVDTGHILLQNPVEIMEADSGGDLRRRCAFTARTMVGELLDRLDTGDFIPRPQDETIAGYHSRINSNDIMIEWNNSAQNIYNQIRSLQPWTCCYTQHKQQFLRITSAQIISLTTEISQGTIIDKKQKNLIVATKDRDVALQLNNVEVLGFVSKLWGGFYVENFVKIGDKLY